MTYISFPTHIIDLHRQELERWLSERLGLQKILRFSWQRRGHDHASPPAAAAKGGESSATAATAAAAAAPLWREEPPPQARAALEEENHLDIQLYRYAKALMEKKLLLSGHRGYTTGGGAGARARSR